MNVFLDTNVVIDFMGERDGFFVNAVRLRPYDYEDAVQYLSSLPHHPDVIITRDKRGFNDFGILVMTPAGFVQRQKNEQGINNSSNELNSKTRHRK